MPMLIFLRLKPIFWKYDIKSVWCSQEKKPRPTADVLLSIRGNWCTLQWRCITSGDALHSACITHCKQYCCTVQSYKIIIESSNWGTLKLWCISRLRLIHCAVLMDHNIELITSALIHLLGKENTIPSLTFFASSCTDLHISVFLYQIVSSGKGLHIFKGEGFTTVYYTKTTNHNNTVYNIMWRSQMISAITGWLDAANVTRYSAYSYFLPISIYSQVD